MIHGAWWKSPVLQGPENDYGQYDYMIEEIPQDYAKWEFDRKCKWPCHDCGRETHLLFRWETFFHTLDGWDSLSHSECWRCRLKGTICSFRWKIKKRTKKAIKTFKMTLELYEIGHKSLSDCYKLAKKIVR